MSKKSAIKYARRRLQGALDGRDWEEARHWSAELERIQGAPAEVPEGQVNMFTGEVTRPQVKDLFDVNSPDWSAA